MNSQSCCTIFSTFYSLKSPHTTGLYILHTILVLQFFPLSSPFFLHGQLIQITLYTRNLTTEKIPTLLTHFGIFSVVKFCVYNLLSRTTQSISIKFIAFNVSIDVFNLCCWCHLVFPAHIYLTFLIGRSMKRNVLTHPRRDFNFNFD